MVNAGNVNLTFETQPQDAVIGPDGTALVPVVVSAKGNGGTPLPEVKITLTVAVNEGSKVELNGTYPVGDLDGDGWNDGVYQITDEGCSSTAACEPEGLAIFEDLTLNKPGGYTLVATAELFGYPLAVIYSDAFHIKQ